MVIISNTIHLFLINFNNYSEIGIYLKVVIPICKSVPILNFFNNVRNISINRWERYNYDKMLNLKHSLKVIGNHNDPP